MTLGRTGETPALPVSGWAGGLVVLSYLALQLSGRTAVLLRSENAFRLWGPPRNPAQDPRREPRWALSGPWCVQLGRFD